MSEENSEIEQNSQNTKDVLTAQSTQDLGIDQLDGQPAQKTGPVSVPSEQNEQSFKETGQDNMDSEESLNTPRTFSKLVTIATVVALLIICVVGGRTPQPSRSVFHRVPLLLPNRLRVRK